MEILSSITVAILAGGQGTRLRPVIGNQPKVLAYVGGRPFLTYLLDQLTVNGFQNVVLCIGYQGEKIKAMFGDTYRNLNLFYSQEAEPLDTAGALRLALPLFKSDPVMVMNGDSYCLVDMKAFYSCHQAREADVTMVLTKVNNAIRYGKVEMDTSGLIKQFGEKTGQNQPGWINAGIYLIRRELLLNIPPYRPISLEKEMFNVWTNYKLYGYFSDGQFIDIGTPEDYALAQRLFVLREEVCVKASR